MVIALIINGKMYELGAGGSLDISDVSFDNPQGVDQYTVGRRVTRHPKDMPSREMAQLTMIRSALELAETSQL